MQPRITYQTTKSSFEGQEWLWLFEILNIVYPLIKLPPSSVCQHLFETVEKISIFFFHKHPILSRIYCTAF